VVMFRPGSTIVRKLGLKRIHGHHCPPVSWAVHCRRSRPVIRLVRWSGGIRMV
jgi:hypothetical protein